MPGCPMFRHETRSRSSARSLLALALISLSGCRGPEPAAIVSDPDDIVVEDVLGREVRLHEPARRIASLSPGFTETLYAVGCGDRIVLRDLWSDFPAAAGSIPEADGVKPGVRHVAGYDPDLVLLYAVDRGEVTAFEKVGLSVAVLDPRTFDEVVADVKKIGRLCGADREAERIAHEMIETRDRVRRSVAQTQERPLAYVEIDGADPVRPWTAGPGSFVHELLTLAGARNVAETVGAPYAQVSAESVIRADPRFVLMLDATPDRGVEATERLMARPGWREMSAVRAGRVIESLDRDMLSRPGPRLAEGLSRLHRALHAKATR